jgi:CHASE3 domain sensor protein
MKEEDYNRLSEELNKAMSEVIRNYLGDCERWVYIKLIGEQLDSMLKIMSVTIFDRRDKQARDQAIEILLSVHSFVNKEVEEVLKEAVKEIKRLETTRIVEYRYIGEKNRRMRKT